MHSFSMRAQYFSTAILTLLSYGAWISSAWSIHVISNRWSGALDMRIMLVFGRFSVRMHLSADTVEACMRTEGTPR